ncbi:threonine/homoserine/homoserine lactone efflux protein [Actinomadura coerulea]|uniref:Threonine/homoserine/homoserine lactone efflux protein n=1 Tax=Actinomadura coerulea TaxID=46159 RepID=A0A7X0KY68_9ACTN|nr:LysE family translocator [Actinomadura coerulea]MBB6395071.1 threonine/homoserine/homoserine lactone efflux protein [Actinomadura coerulea]GGQ14597.1 threonine transporter RhtB [Actinomadura coerulea]
MLESLLAFAGAAVLIALVPGPSTVVIMRQSMRSGRRAGLAAVLGNETGVLLWGVAAAVGLSALLAASRLAYEGLRVAGAVVLVWFGVRALWRARRGGPGSAGAGEGLDVEGDGPGAGGTGWRSYRLGLVTNFANPKAGVFAVSFLPQFVPEGWPVAAVLVGFSVLWALIDLVWYTAVVWLVGAARQVLGRPGVRRRLDQVSGVVLVGLGVRLAAEAR